MSELIDKGSPPSTFRRLSQHFSSPDLPALLLGKTGESSCPSALGTHSTWTLTDNIGPKMPQKKGMKLPLASFNHIAREVLSLEKSRMFYVDILGFDVCPRPPFDCAGYWLYGYGLSLHLVLTTVPEQRKQVKLNRIKHFSSALPRVDHFAFVTDDIMYVKSSLDEAKVYYKYVIGPVGIEQLFLFDPDGNVIEISNCHAGLSDDGEVMCSTQMRESNKDWLVDRLLSISLDSDECGSGADEERKGETTRETRLSSSVTVTVTAAEDDERSSESKHQPSASGIDLHLNASN